MPSSNIKEIKELKDADSVNELLGKGWKLIYCEFGKYVMGRAEPNSHK